MRLKPEEAIHVRVVAELRRSGVRFFHCANESKSTPAYRAKLARLGLSKGVPDLMIMTPPPCGGYTHAALELKSDKGRITPEQKEWLAFLEAHGWAVACTKGLDESLSQLISWGYIDG
jgi:hypothetical protein